MNTKTISQWRRIWICVHSAGTGSAAIVFPAITATGIRPLPPFLSFFILFPSTKAAIILFWFFWVSKITMFNNIFGPKSGRCLTFSVTIS